MKSCFTAEFNYESHPFNSFDLLLRHVWARIIHVIWPCWFVGNQDKKPMILCPRSTSRSRELSTKCRSRSENVWKVCLVYSQNNKIIWLSNMTDTFSEKFTRCAEVCGRFFLYCAFRTLIGYADEIRSHGQSVTQQCLRKLFQCGQPWSTVIAPAKISTERCLDRSPAFCQTASPPPPCPRQ